MSKIANEFVQRPKESSFLIREFKEEAFSAPYHSHREYELTLVTGGCGKRYVGSHIADFQPGDLVLLGSGLPHCWKLGDKVTRNELPGALVIHFDYAFLGEHFMNCPENQHIKNLLRRSVGGIKFDRDLQHQIIKTGCLKNRFERLINFLEILNDLASAHNFKILDQNDGLLNQTSEHDGRIKKVFAYIVENFHNRMTLEEVAELINMTPQAFCKYFKAATRKTFTDVVIDYRIDYASSQLTSTEKPVSTIGFESGFGDRSYFSKKFKKKTGYAPSQYRKAFKRL